MLFVMVRLLKSYLYRKQKREVRKYMRDLKSKNHRTFLLNIQDRQNATWQGSVTWVERNQRQNFRSALELIKLIESALEENEKDGGESHEK